MNRRTLLYVAAGLAGFSAIVHLSLGVGGLVEVATGTEHWLLPVGFLAAALVVVGLLAGMALGTVAPRTAYATGAVLMVLHVVAYADWHAVGLFESTVGLEEGSHDHAHDDDHSHGDGHAHDHSHDGPVHEVLLDHLRADLLALSAKMAETGAAIAFVALYVLETRDQ